MTVKEENPAVTWLLKKLPHDWVSNPKRSHVAEAALSKWFMDKGDAPDHYDYKAGGIETTHSCHAKIMHVIKDGFQHFATIVHAYAPEGESFLQDFVLHPKFSPWRAVVPEGSWAKVLDKDGVWVGIEFLDPQVCKDHPHLFYNLLIALRQPAEYPDIINGWYDIVRDYDLYKADAYVLASFFNVRAGWVWHNKLDGAHKPLRYYGNYGVSDYIFDVVRFRQGRYDSTVTTSSQQNIGWCTKGQKEYAVDLQKAGKGVTETVQTRFSSIKVTKGADQIVARFKELVNG
jgi:hypothetical protein